MDNELRIYHSKKKLVGLFLLTFVMAGTSYFATTQTEGLEFLISWFGVFFFGIGFLAFPRLFFRRGPQIIINEKGIEDCRTKRGVIRWADIEMISITSVSSVKFLSIDVKKPSKYRSKLSRVARILSKGNRFVGSSEIAIGFVGLDQSIEDVCEYIQKNYSIKIIDRKKREW